jgi:hypothetical protein
MQPVALLMDGYLRGLYQATTLMLFLAMVGLVFLVQTEGLSQLVGGWGEDATRAEIDAARKRGQLWGLSTTSSGVAVTSIILFWRRRG